MFTGNFCYRDFLAYIKISNDVHLVVEGRTDKRFFDTLFSVNGLDDYVFVNSIEDIYDFPQDNGHLGNREKVEFICHDCSDGLNGFVDREFREYLVTDRVHDLLNTHNNLGNILWSRGHSIENYCFDYNILAAPLRAQSRHDCLFDAIKIFEKNFEVIIRQACVLTLVASHFTLLKKFERLDFLGILVLQNGEISVDIEELITQSLSRGVIDNSQKGEFFDEWEKSLSLIGNSDLEVVKWYIHGHLGFKFLWSSYCFIIGEIAKTEGENRSSAVSSDMNRLDIAQRFYCCLEEWLRSNEAKNFIKIITSFLHLTFGD